jgi:hypothetical protein
MGGGTAPKEEELRKVEAVRRRMSEVPERLIITRNGDAVTITDDFGRSYTLKADGKKQERVTGDGEFKSKTRFEAAKLIVRGRLRRAEGHDHLHANARRRRDSAARGQPESGGHARGRARAAGAQARERRWPQRATGGQACLRQRGALSRR